MFGCCKRSGIIMVARTPNGIRSLSQRWCIGCLVVAVFAATAFYFLYISYVPTSDDMFYKFICNDINKGATASEVGLGTQYIESMSDVMTSMNWFYFHVNGRYLVHVVVQACTAMMSPQVFGIINSIFYLLFLALLYSLSFSEKRKDSVAKAVVCATSAWLFIPFQGNTFLGGVATSVNYLWPSVSSLSLMILQSSLSEKGKEHNAVFLILMFLFGAFVGSLQESFSVGLAGAYFFYLLINCKNVKQSEWWLLIGLFVGACFCVFAPGNMARLSSQGTSAGSSSFLLGCLSSWAIDLLLVSVVVMYFVDRKYLVKTLYSCRIILGVMFFNALFCMFIAYIGRHQLTCISVLSLIVLFRIWFDYRKWTSLQFNGLACLLLIPSIALYCYVYDVRKTRYETFTNMCQQAVEKGGNSYVTCREFDNVNYVVGNNPLICHYYVGHLPFIGDYCLKRALSLSLSKGKNICLLDNLYPDEPQKIAKLCNKTNRVSANVYRIFNNHFVYVSPRKIEQNKINTILEIKGRAFFLPNTEEKGSAREHFEWAGRHYYLLGNRGALSPIVGVKEVKIEQ